jgi:adenine-specific DNA-methyltransferase
MPTLEWIGKDKVVNHHMEVPYRVLNHQYTYMGTGEKGTEIADGNKIIRGDNLEALKALLPQYEGRVKCIYIDPPYNTGNEGWVYNDNVTDPKIKRWLGQVVGKEGEDLSRHDKWLCMMYPRLKLLQRLLSDDGAIFISIDDNEQANLRLICDEIFGSVNFIALFTWKRRASSAMALRNVSIDHEYVLSYGKSKTKSFWGKSKDYKGYSNPDNDPRGAWTTGDLTVGMTAEMRPNQYYDLVDPSTGVVYKPSASRVWSYIPESMEVLIAENRIVFPDSPDKRPMKKRFASELKTDNNPISTWMEDVGINTEGTKAVKKIFGESVFSYSKPKSLIELLCSQITVKNDIILDSFAGSGTTAHAVLNMNKMDGGNRKFILIEMMDYAEDITAERVRRIIDGYANVEGTGGSFSFYDLGEPLMLDENTLNENVPTEKIRQYVFFIETKQPMGALSDAEPYLLGRHMNSAYYFYYERARITTLNHDFLATVRTEAEGYVIYADLCALGNEELKDYHITFKKIPRDISRL